VQQDQRMVEKRIVVVMSVSQLVIASAWDGWTSLKSISEEDVMYVPL